MKRRNVAYALVLFLGLLYAFHITGCSLIGLGVGAIVDANSKGSRVVPAHDYAVIERGKMIELHLRTGSATMAGRFLGGAQRPYSEWLARYAAARETAVVSGPLPSPGDTIRLMQRSHRVSEGEFQGLWIDRVDVQHPVAGSSPVVPHRSFDRIEWRGDTLGVDRLVTLERLGVLPTLTALRVATASGEVLVPADEVAWINAPTERHAASIGFLVGLVADVILVVTTVAAVNDAKNDGCSTTTTSMLEDPNVRAVLRTESFARSDLEPPPERGLSERGDARSRAPAPATGGHSTNPAAAAARQE